MAKPRSYWRSKGVNPESAEMALRYHEGYQRCGICGGIDPRGHNWCVDHDHRLEPDAPVRGILCNKCNLGLGYFDDDIARLRLAADYLEAAKPTVQERIRLDAEMARTGRWSKY